MAFCIIRLKCASQAAEICSLQIGTITELRYSALCSRAAVLLRDVTRWGIVLLVIGGLFGVNAELSAFPRVPPQEYGRVVIKNYSERAGLAPVVFNHWLHRARFTCRLC